jgi:hypothetical protein
VQSTTLGVRTSWKQMDPSVGKTPRVNVGFSGSSGAVPTNDEPKIDRLPRMDWLTKAPGTSTRLRQVPDQAHPAKGCPMMPACYLDRQYRSGIHPKRTEPQTEHQLPEAWFRVAIFVGRQVLVAAVTPSLTYNF